MFGRERVDDELPPVKILHTHIASRRVGARGGQRMPFLKLFLPGPAVEERRLGLVVAHL